MTEGEFPFRSFTLRAEGYDRGEVDGYVGELQGEIVELRRALDAATHTGIDGDARLHDPEGAVTRTLAIAQETADRVLHDAQVEADRRRAEADEQAETALSDAETRASTMLADIEKQAADVRAHGIAAARAAIQVERDKAVAELGQIRRVRDDIRAEAVELKAVLDAHARQATEASETLAAAANGPLLTFELPEYIADDVALAGVLDSTEAESVASIDAVEATTDAEDSAPPSEGSPASLAAVESSTPPTPVWADADVDTSYDADGANDDEAPTLAAVDPADAAEDDGWTFATDDEPLADVISIDGESDERLSDIELTSDLDDDEAAASGAFLAEVQAAADDPPLFSDDDEVAAGDSDRFLSELRSVTDVTEGAIDDEAADRFFDSE